jgi:hypothetical protein
LDAFANLAKCLAGNFQKQVSGPLVDHLIVNLVLGIDSHVGGKGSGANNRNWSLLLRGRFGVGTFRHHDSRSSGWGSVARGLGTLGSANLQGQLGGGDTHTHSPLFKAAEGTRMAPSVRNSPSFDYWSSFNTACSWELACARAAMPVCSSTWYLDIFATTCPIFASLIPLKDEVRFWDVLVMTVSAAFI